MAHVLVAGLINIETTLQIDRFPIVYTPVRFPFFGIQSTVSGVGYNISSALTKLGHNVRFCALIGSDDGGSLVTAQLHADRIDEAYVQRQLEQTPQSVILYDADGRRAINTDLKDIQDQLYPVESFEQALSKTSLAVLCNINFARPMLDRTRQAGIPIATDVHTIADLNDMYNRDYMASATILFQSHEKLPVPPEDWARLLWNRYGTPIIVIGLGAEGALLAVRDDRFVERIPAVYTRPVVSTIGAGDALFSGFVHTYIHTGDPYLAIKKGVVYASYKIGTTSAAQGLLNAAELDEWTTRVYSV
jgi:sugar/nucleoside kinase (ribokinase family)